MTRLNVGRRALASGVGVAGLLLLGGLFVAANAADPRPRACGANGGGHVQAAFAMDHASSFWSHFPNALQAPELEVDTPAYVVVFSGPVKLVIAGNPNGAGGSLQQATFDHVVCVLVGDTPNFYYNVDTTGFQP
jgi:hypothetical protein